jgi:hypothetical protein
MRLKQAAAAVGQCSIMFLYDKFFRDYDETIAQILLNAEDIRVEEKKDNLINTFGALLEMGVIPVVNENDSVSYTEIESDERLFGDNDMLSAVVAVLCRASRLVILSDINGLYDADPRLYPNAKLIGRVERIDDSTMRLPAARDPGAAPAACAPSSRRRAGRGTGDRHRDNQRQTSGGPLRYHKRRQRRNDVRRQKTDDVKPLFPPGEGGNFL